MMQSSGFPKLLVEGLREVLDQAMVDVPTYYDRVFNVMTSNKATELDFDFAGGDPFEEVATDNTPTPYRDLTNGFQTAYTHFTYKGGEEITRAMYDDDLYNVMNKTMMRLGRHGGRFYDKRAFRVFHNGFDTSFTSYGDNKPLFSTSHTRADGGTAQSNASSTGIALTDTNLEIGILALQEVVDHTGEMIDLGMGEIILMVPPKLRKQALVITESERVSDSADNAINVYYSSKYNLTLIVNPWISARAGGSDTAWFLLDADNHQLNMFIRVPIEFKSEIGSGSTFDTDSLKFKGYGRMSVGWSGWLGVWGSKGDGAAYSS